MRRLTAILAVLPLLAHGPQAQAADMRTDRATGCRFSVPSALRRMSAAWLGPCRGGLAEGAGVLRAEPAHGGAPVVFYGLMRAGLPVRGLVEDASGWTMGEFRDGVMVVDRDDADAGIKTFRAATQGAEAAARLYAARHNAASAAFYRRKAGEIDATSPGGH